MILDVFEAIQKERMEDTQECFDRNFKSNIILKVVSREEYLDVYRRIKEGIPYAKIEVINLMTNG